MKTAVDWIKVKLREHGMALYHLAAKMRIASTLGRAWKRGKVRPDVEQIRAMVNTLGTAHCQLTKEGIAMFLQPNPTFLLVE
ncbi:MAG TPA: helix-turn-helix transcriptional regulator [Verrucomicrobiae bacterium]